MYQQNKQKNPEEHHNLKSTADSTKSRSENKKGREPEQIQMEKASERKNKKANRRKNKAGNNK